MLKIPNTNTYLSIILTNKEHPFEYTYQAFNINLFNTSEAQWRSNKFHQTQSCTPYRITPNPYKYIEVHKSFKE